MRAAFGGGGSAWRRYAARLEQPRRLGAAVDELGQCRRLERLACRWPDSGRLVRLARSARTRENAVEDQHQARSLFAGRYQVSLSDPSRASPEGPVNWDAPEGVAQV